jgi:outer membrane protein assembly factor BamB
VVYTTGIQSPDPLETGFATARDAVTDAKLWSSSEGPEYGSPPTVAGGTVFAGRNGSAPAMLAFRGTDGSTAWSVPAPGEQFDTAPTVSGTTVYFRSRTTLFARDAKTGAAKWQVSLPALTLLTARSPVVTNGIVYEASETGLVLYDADTGAVLRTITTGFRPDVIRYASGEIFTSEAGGHLRVYGAHQPIVPQPPDPFACGVSCP